MIGMRRLVGQGFAAVAAVAGVRGWSSFGEGVSGERGQPCSLYTPRGYLTQARSAAGTHPESHEGRSRRQRGQPKPTTKSRTVELARVRDHRDTTEPGSRRVTECSSRGRPQGGGSRRVTECSSRGRPQGGGSRRVTECSSPEAALSGRSRRPCPDSTENPPRSHERRTRRQPGLPEPTTESRTAPGLDQSSPNPQAVRTISARCPRRPLLLPRSPDRRRCGRRPRRGPRRPGSRPPRCGSPRSRSSRCSRRRWPGRRRTSR